MFKAIGIAVTAAIGTSLLGGCAVYHHPHHDDIVVEPAGYRIHDREEIEHHDDRGDHDRDRHEDHEDH